MNKKGTTEEIEVEVLVEGGHPRVITMGEHRDSTREPNRRDTDLGQIHSDPKHFIRPPDQHPSMSQPIIVLDQLKNNEGVARHKVQH
ncbi:hypothetical protein A2U01_0063915 [Trifolium medium]|uniref:Uncharacterized protein n=1 Tax=Trifolium medium TaxID=97028 RepID=A0A392S1F3_9FABA|nr:hypothetical protein [Trifolium medium]